MAQDTLVSMWSAQTPPLPHSWIPEQLLRDHDEGVEFTIDLLRAGFEEDWRDEFEEIARLQLESFLEQEPNEDLTRFIVFPLKRPFAAEASIAIGQPVTDEEVAGSTMVDVVRSRSLGVGIVTTQTQADAESGIVSATRSVLFTDDRRSVLFRLGPAPVPVIAAASIGLAALVQGTVVKDESDDSQFVGEHTYGYLENAEEPLDALTSSFDFGNLPVRGTDMEWFEQAQQ